MKKECCEIGKDELEQVAGGLALAGEQKALIDDLAFAGVAGTNLAEGLAEDLLAGVPKKTLADSADEIKLGVDKLADGLARQ